MSRPIFHMIEQCYGGLIRHPDVFKQKRPGELVNSKMGFINTIKELVTMKVQVQALIYYIVSNRANASSMRDREKQYPNKFKKFNIFIAKLFINVP